MEPYTPGFDVWSLVRLLEGLFDASDAPSYEGELRDFLHSYAAVEVAKYRDTYHAGYSALVAPSFDGQLAFVSELHTHGVLKTGSPPRTARTPQRERRLTPPSTGSPARTSAARFG